MSQIRLPAAAAEALANGRFVEAVKIVRDAGGMKLKEARSLVQAYHEQTLHDRASTTTTTQPTPAAPAAGGVVFPQDAAEAIARGEVLQAIAAMRRANPRLDLRSAKEAVDQFRTGQATAPAVPRAKPQHVPTIVEGDRGGYTALLVMVFVALVALCWWLFSATS